jgi:hypothetical protein
MLMVKPLDSGRNARSSVRFVMVSQNRNGCPWRCGGPQVKHKDG